MQYIGINCANNSSLYEEGQLADVSPDGYNVDGYNLVRSVTDICELNR